MSKWDKLLERLSKVERSVPFDDMETLQADTSEADTMALRAALAADTSERDTLARRKALRNDHSERNRWKRGM